MSQKARSPMRVTVCPAQLAGDRKGTAQAEIAGDGEAAVVIGFIGELGVDGGWESAKVGAPTGGAAEVIDGGGGIAAEDMGSAELGGFALEKEGGEVGTGIEGAVAEGGDACAEGWRR